jgi:hypothetical protein
VLRRSIMGFLVLIVAPCRSICVSPAEDCPFPYQEGHHRPTLSGKSPSPCEDYPYEPNEEFVQYVQASYPSPCEDYPSP